MSELLKPSRRMILRLCRYRNYLFRLQKFGVEVCLSDEIASALSLTSAQVRKDFSVFGISGRRKSGYRLNALLPALNRILSHQKVRQAVVIGVNPLAQALVSEQFLLENHIQILAAFAEPSELARWNAVDSVALPMNELPAFVREHRIQYAILAITTLPAAQQALDKLALSGIKNILSLAPVELVTPTACWVHSVNLAAEFDNLVYFSSGPLGVKAASSV